MIFTFDAAFLYSLRRSVLVLNFKFLLGGARAVVVYLENVIS